MADLAILKLTFLTRGQSYETEIVPNGLEVKKVYSGNKKKGLMGISLVPGSPTLA